MRGLNCGRFFAAKISATASSLVASAPSPYTVSVGNATSPPRRRMAAARRIDSAFAVWRFVLTAELAASSSQAYRKVCLVAVRSTLMDTSCETGDEADHVP